MPKFEQPGQPELNFDEGAPKKRHFSDYLSEEREALAASISRKRVGMDKDPLTPEEKEYENWVRQFD